MHRPAASILSVYFSLLFSIAGAAESSPAPQHPAISQSPHVVFAHYMPCCPPLGLNPSNDYWYGARLNPTGDNQICWPVLTAREDKDHVFEAYVDEIRLAKQYGIDGFLVDQLEDQEVFTTCWLNLLKAAEQVGGFKIGLMPDYATLWNDTSKTSVPDKILHWLTLAKDSPALLRYDGKPTVMLYGCGCPDGKGAPPEEKARIFDYLASKGMPVAFAATHGAGWPLYQKPYANDPQTGFQTYAFGTGTFSPFSRISEREHLLDYWPASMLQMGEDSFMYYNRGWCYAAPHLSEPYRLFWKWNIAHRDRIQWMQLITWNDQGESAIQATNNHFMAWQALTRHYADWFKTGAEPAITHDWLGVFHRPHPYDAKPVLVMKTLDSARPTDEVEAIAMLTTPATLVITTGGETVRQDVGAGVQSFITAFKPGVQSARIERNGTTIATVTSPIPVHLKPARQNLWFIGADSDHPPRPVTLTWPTQDAWQGVATAQTGSGLMVTGDAWRLLDVRIEASLVPGARDAGLVVRRLGQCHVQFTVQVEGALLVWHLTAVDGDKTTALSTGSRPAHAGPLHLRLDSVSDRVIAYCDGELVDGDTYVFTPFNGQVGLVSTAVTAFKDLTLQSFDPEVPVR